MCTVQVIGLNSFFFAYEYAIVSGFPDGSGVNNLPAMQETRVLSLGQEDPQEEEMAIHSSIAAWKIPQTAEPGDLQSMGSQRAGHDLATKQQLLLYVLCQ